MYSNELTKEFGRIGAKFLADMNSGWLDDATVADMKKVMERFHSETADAAAPTKES